MGLKELTEREHLKLTTLEYHVEEEGHFLSEPIIELFARDAGGNRRRIEVEGFYPFFFITEDEYREHEHDIFNESMIRSVTAREFVTSEENINNAALTETDLAPRTTLKGEQLVKIETVVPSHVKKLKEMDIFDRTWEADVFFTNRFLINSGITSGFSVPKGVDRVRYDQIESLDTAPDVAPRVLTIDIEVWSGGSFPDTQHPTKPITAVTTHDSYSDEYKAAVLHPEAVDRGDDTWDDSTEERLRDASDKCEIEVFHDEAEMLEAFNQWIIEKDPDLLTGWNSSRNEIGSGFDYPYWINRCQRINVWSIEDISPTESCFVTDRGSPVVGGREMFDMLQAYKKTQIHEKRSYSLGYIAQEELGYGKEDVADLDEGWLHEPVEFMEYNIRDVEAVVEIESSKSVLEMYDHIRSIAGATYSEIADSNIGIIDILYLREAKKRDLALPTSTRPEVQHYWGAYVFPPVAGKHKNVVYPDLSSLYPNLFKDMNASPETIIGFEEDLEASEYTEDDCHEVYVDTRSEAAKRAADEPERTSLYVLKPEVKESFVRDVIGDLIDMKYEYKKDEYADEAYEAVKRITNSVYGCMGDSVSYGVGFRLFDWRIAEAITLAGRDVIKHTAETMEETVQKYGYPDTDIIAGDSVLATEPVIIKRDGDVKVTKIKSVQVGDKVWSDEGFTTVKNVVKKPNRKQLYSVRSQTGIVHTTSDHGLLYEDGTEVTPENVNTGEKLLHNDLKNIELDESNDLSEEEAFLLGVFCAEGSAGIYETGSEWDDSKAQVKVSNQDIELLERVSTYFDLVYDFNMKIYDDVASSNVHNLKPFDNDIGDISEVASVLRERCYTDSGEKRVPERIFSAPTEVKKSFLDGFHAGDGHIKKGNYKQLKEYDEMWSKSPVLLQGVVLLLRNIGIDVSLSWRNNHESQYYRARCPNFRRVDKTECREVETYEYTGTYVYDLETENHHFAAGIGSMVVHNTDSCVLSIEEADGVKESLDVAQEAAEYVDSTFEDFMYDRFGIEDGNMAVEIESYAEAALFMEKKKRYAQWIRWDEGDYVDEVEVKGFELVRSDSSPLTAEVQKEVLTMILKQEDAKSSVSVYLKENWDAVIDGNVALEDIGKPSAINNKLWDYGWSVSVVEKGDQIDDIEGNRLERGDEYAKFFTPQPHIRGARYANAHVENEDISQGDKPLMFYADGVQLSSELPELYDYDDKSLNVPDDVAYENRREIKELGREVDAIAVEDVRNLPDEILIDWEKMAAKTLRDPIEPIVDVMGWDFDDLIQDGTQSDLSAFM